MEDITPQKTAAIYVIVTFGKIENFEDFVEYIYAMLYVEEGYRFTHRVVGQACVERREWSTASRFLCETVDHSVLKCYNIRVHMVRWLLIILKKHYA